MIRFEKPRRKVDRVFIHCSASDNPNHDNIDTMRAWHKANGWNDVGYHFFIRKSGQIEAGRPLSRTPAAQKPHNSGTIAICLHGLKESRFTKSQFGALIGLCGQIHAAYDGCVAFHGHREVANKACPVFDYRRVLGLDDRGRMGTSTRSGFEVRPDPKPSRPLVRGDRGKSVRDLQEHLQLQGLDVGPIDGHFGPRTERAVIAFQFVNKLRV